MKSIDMNNGSDSGFQIVGMEDGYLLVVGSLCANNSVNCLGFLRIDWEFEDIYYKS